MLERENRIEIDPAPRLSSSAVRPRDRGHNTKQARRSVLVVGSSVDLPRALTHPAILKGSFKVVASVDVEVDAAEESAAAFMEAMNRTRDERVDALLVAGEIGPSVMRCVADIALAHQLQVLALMPTEVLQEHEPVIVWTRDGPLIQLARLPRRPIHSLIKRAMDVVGAAAGLILCAPLLAVLAVLIKLESPGAFVFKHERLGYRGRKFKCLKLRTMRENAEDVLHADPEMYERYRRNHYKLPDETDHRVTRIGRFLRRTSLDELPQFWNVLVGDMSLVGPRPVVEDEIGEFGEFRDLVLSVRPGLTGAWAVSGRQAIGYPKRCEIEVQYVRERTLLADLQILVRTVGVVSGLD